MEGTGFYKLGICVLANNYGLEHRLNKTLEETSELNVEVSRFVTKNNPDIEKLIDEIADVRVMLDQLEFLLGIGQKVKERKEFKVRRQLERIGRTNDII